MTRWIDGRPGLWFGYTDLGPIQIPPLPPYIVLTDRVTGLLYWLTTDPTSTFVAITLNSPPKGQPSITYPAFNEPYISGFPGEAQLIVSNGVLGVGQVIPALLGNGSFAGTPIYARQASLGQQGTTMLLISLVGLGPGNGSPFTYGFQPVTFTPTPNPPAQ